MVPSFFSSSSLCCVNTSPLKTSLNSSLLFLDKEQLDQTLLNETQKQQDRKTSSEGSSAFTSLPQRSAGSLLSVHHGAFGHACLFMLFMDEHSEKLFFPLVHAKKSSPFFSLNESTIFFTASCGFLHPFCRKDVKKIEKNHCYLTECLEALFLHNQI